jgi:SAM-dependent methyltransferase
MPSATKSHAYIDFYVLPLQNDISAAGRRRFWKDYSHLYLPFLPPEKDARILDFGCGAGILLEWLRDDVGFLNLSGIDADQGQVEFARSLGLNVEQTDDSSAWMVQHKPFDTIIMKSVLEHIPAGADTVALRGVFDALAAGGRLIATVPNANATFATRRRYIDPTHWRSYTEYTLRYALQCVGFSRIQILAEETWRPASFKCALRLGIKCITRAWRRLEAIGEEGGIGLHFPLSENLLAVCTKDGFGLRE